MVKIVCFSMARISRTKKLKKLNCTKKKKKNWKKKKKIGIP
jgi:hypothetical protein